MYGRDVLLLPERPGVREGVAIVMLTSPTGQPTGQLAARSGGHGRAARPLKTFTFG